MSTLYILVGLPGSGKSTWAAKFAKENHNILIVNRDAIRNSIKGGTEYVFNLDYEESIKEATDSQVQIFLEHGFDVIVDETNIKVSRRRQLSINNGNGCGYRIVPKIIYVAFDAGEKNLENRMKESRGVNASRWKSIIRGMEKSKEPIDVRKEDFDEFWLTTDAGESFLKGKKFVSRFWK